MDYNEVSSSHLGVTMDIVIAWSYPGDPKTEVTDDALRFMQDHGICDSLEEAVYSLLGKSEMDTGIPENTILTKLDQGVKQGFRVVKYLIQLLHDNEHNEYTKPSLCLTHHIDEALYGFKPKMKSYLLRCLLMELLIQTHNTPCAEQLKGGTLALCLLDILSCIVPVDARTDISIPLTDRFFVEFNGLPAGPINSLVDILMDCNMQYIDRFPLLNTHGVPHYESITLNNTPRNHICFEMHSGEFLTFDEWTNRCVTMNSGKGKATVSESDDCQNETKPRCNMDDLPSSNNIFTYFLAKI